jgi:23S rRNA pseudouridine1911/1915/1917 synthase
MSAKQTFKKDSLFTVKEDDTLMEFLLVAISHKNRNNIKALLRHRQIMVNGAAQTQFDYELVPDDTVTVKWNKSSETDVSTGIRIIHEDKNFYVAHKDAGILTYPVKQDSSASVYSKLLHYAKRKNPRIRLYLVKSLDKDSSGLVMFAKGDKNQTPLIEAINASASFTYHAVLEGPLAKGDKGENSIRTYESKVFKMHFTNDPKAEKSVCEYEVGNTNQQYSSVRFVTTGSESKHQIRMHALDLGFPIVGDKRYGSVSSPIKRLALHRSRITFTNPFSKVKESFDCAKPRKFSRLI